jgi:hypothetical protein
LSSSSNNALSKYALSLMHMLKIASLANVTPSKFASLENLVDQKLLFLRI